MKIAGLHIDGFGIFHDLEISGLKTGLNVFLGENESGKTTLLAFVRAMLFGFPPGQRRENIYQPQTGGRHGGKLTLVDEAGEQYIVSRHHGPKRGSVTVTLSDGSQGEHEVLRQLTGAATEDLFRSVFAFSLLELQRFESLNSREVKAAIYSAGTGLGKVSLAQVEKGLKGSLGQIFKPGGRNPVINSLFRKLQDIDLTIGQIVAEIDHYDELRDELSQVAEQVQTKKNHLDVKRHRLERVKLLERAWGDWVSLCRIQEEIADLPEIEIFPTDGVNRLEKLQERNRVLNTHGGELISKIEQVEKDLSGLEARPQWLAAVEQIRLLERGLERYSAASQDLIEIHPRLENERESLEKDLQGLGPDWQLENLDQFDASVSARDEVLRCQERLERARDAKRQAERSVASTTSGLKRAKVRAREAEKAISQIKEPKEKDPDVLLERRRGVRSLRNLIQTGRDLQRGLEHLRERQEDLGGQRNGLSQQMAGIETAPLWPVAVVVLLSLAAGLAAGWYRDSFTGATVVAVGLLLSVALLWFSLGQRRRQKTQRDLLKQQFYEIEKKLNSLSGEEAHLLAEISANDQEMVRPAQALGLAIRPSLEKMDLAEAGVEAEQEALHIWQPAHQRYQDSREETERRQRELDEAKQSMAGAQKELQESEQQWLAWLRKAGLTESLTPNSALEVMERIRSLRQQAGSIRELEERLRVLERFVQDYQEEAKSIAQQLEVRDIVMEDVEAIVNRLVAELEREEENQRSLDTLQRQLVGHKAEREQNDAHVQEVETELKDLFAEGGATDEAEFRQKDHLYQRRLEAKEDLEQHSRSLENLGGRGEDQVGFQDELQQCSPERLHTEKEELKREVDVLEQKLASLQEHYGRLDERREQLESAEELSELRQQRSKLAAELADAARRWSTLTICLRFMQEARKTYEKERKKPVVLESVHFFRTITDDRYRTIVAPLGEERIQVIGGDGERYELDTLSRGTAEQLYLSLRFGYIREFGRQDQPLPVVMDDVLVNFDPKRARAAISGILELAKQNQVLFFTCHPETVSLFKKLDKNIPICQLKGGECRKA